VGVKGVEGVALNKQIAKWQLSAKMRANKQIELKQKICLFFLLLNANCEVATTTSLAGLSK